MKSKLYISPTIKVRLLELETMLSASNGVAGEQGTPVEDITYGGVDEEGTKDPSARFTHIFDDQLNEEW